MGKAIILLALADLALRRRVAGLLLDHGFEVVESADAAGARMLFQKARPDLAILGSCEDSVWNALELAREIRLEDKKVPLILLMASSSEELAIAALRAGVDDYFKPPFPLAELVQSVRRCLSASGRRDPPVDPERGPSGLSDADWIIGKHPAIRKIGGYIAKVAVTDSQVLITGETGTGKELVAELIHASSPRHEKPFICVNSAAIPDSLLESELFGYERGAFTGAHSLKEGALKLADGGTVFFDEIGDMSPYAQAKILRSIENKEVHRLGGRKSVPVDVRFIAATNQDLEQLVAQDKFRKDLYFRLNVARIHLPPLRDRREDIPLLFDHYIKQLNHRFSREVEGFGEDALDALLRYDWPGNVRELKNLLEAIFVDLPPPRISFADLPEQYQRRFRDAAPLAERDRLLSALLSTKWNKSKAARKLHWSRMTLYRKMAKYQIIQYAGGTRVDTGITS